MEAAIAALAGRLGHRFGDAELLRQALRHRSWCAEHPGHESNERLEFLGDAVLGWVVADLVYRGHLDSAEGRLTDLRKSVVNAAALAEIATDLGLGGCLALGKGEDSAGGRFKPSILSDAMEAVIGAVYLDGGADAAYAMVAELLEGRLVAADELPPYADFKTMLQEIVARRSEPAPVYVLSEEGPDHAKRFFASVLVEGSALGDGEGTSKKQAEQRAAQQALLAIKSRSSDEGSGA
jgi:ribonuclease-3